MDMNRTRAVCHTNFGLYYFTMNPQQILWGLEPQSTALLFSWEVPLHWCRIKHWMSGQSPPPKKLLFLQCADWNWALCVPAVLPFICRLQLHCKMHSDPQLLLLRISYFSRAMSSVCVETFLWSDLDRLAYERSAVLQPNGITGMVSYYTFAIDFVSFCRYKINLLYTVCALMTAMLAGISSGDLEARENRHMRNILDNTYVGSVASSSRIRIKSCWILFLHIAVCRDNGSLFVTYM